MGAAPHIARVLPRRLGSAVAMALFSFVAGCGSGDPPTVQVAKFSGPTMGTTYKVSVVAPLGSSLESLQGLVDARLAELNARMSTYDPDSELSRFNALESDAWFTVSGETAAVVEYSLRVAEDSDGAFDPTIGPLVNLWGFGPEGSRFEPPSQEAIDSARERVGRLKLLASTEPPALKKSESGVYADLSAVAKGYGVDAVAALLEEEGFGSFMVEIGGEVRAQGEKPGGTPWRIGVESADSLGGELQTIVELRNSAIATSGDYRNFFTHDGRRYSHTIDPVTGVPVEHTTATVSVIADTCREADALATALLVMGADRAYDWAAERGVAALLVERGGDDRLTATTTPNWDARAGAGEIEP